LTKLHLVLLLHAHQPVGNFDEVFERTYQRAYLPFLNCLERHPGVRLGLHYSGPLLEWIEKAHPEFFDLLRALVGCDQVEMVGGGFYEPILVSIPPVSQQEQILRMARYLEKHFRRKPTGAWLAERVWEPQLPAVLHQAGVEYTLVDDNHFLAAGIEADALCGCYIAEDRGSTVNVIPGLKALRYLIPFRSVEENLNYLRNAAAEHPGGCVAMGDDCEKFGSWPGTHEHCYSNGWLERYFSMLEANSDWLSLTSPGEYIAAHGPLGRADLPTASYPEMMEWVLPTVARQRFHSVQQEFASRPDVQQFLRGGFWRGFLSKYAEANLLHKKMLNVAGRLEREVGRRLRTPRKKKKLEAATTHLLRAQCNDAYWHGVFGGLYSPHLRTALWQELIRAEKITEAMSKKSGAPRVKRLDFDADGEEEIYLTSRSYAALVKPSDGATLPALDFRARDVTLINSLQRRVEAYHARLREAGKAGSGVASIHEQTRAKEEGLERHLRYDRWPRHAFRLLLFSPWKTPNDHAALSLEESALFAGGRYAPEQVSASRVELVAEGPLIAPAAGATADPALRAIKKFSFSENRGGFEIACDLALSYAGTQPVKLLLGLEVVLNFLAPNAPDRYLESGTGERQPLRWTGVMPAPMLRIVDEWQNVAATLEAPRATHFWIAPIETVSESEEGFERVYQGSQILAVWPVELDPKTPWEGRLVLRVTSAHK
jgi:alpha-amylase